MKSAKFNIKLRKLIILTIVWLCVGAFITIYDYVTTADTEFYIRKAEYNFITDLVANLLGALIGSLTGGFLLIFYLKDKFRTQPFGFIIFINTLIYLCLIILIIILIGLVINTNWFTQAFTINEIFLNIYATLTRPLFLKTLIVWMITVSGTSFILQVSDKYGPGVLIDFILGKYHKPQQEKRIFMFVDMKSSTTIAEQLGDVVFYRLLNNYFEDLTDPIIYAKGEVYQYVGDEIVISWKMKNGLENANCIRCFFAMQDAVNSLKEKYTENYGLAPEFKAGLHCGVVTLGEIGVLKKDIVFTGDVLNTTSRIQAECNAYNVKLLISESLLDLIDLNNSFRKIDIGEIALRGKQDKVRLFTIQTKNKLL